MCTKCTHKHSDKEFINTFLYMSIRKAKNDKELDVALQAYLRNIPNGSKIKIEDLTSNEKRKKAIISWLKTYIDCKTFAEDNFHLIFNGPDFSVIKKMGFDI